MTKGTTHQNSHTLPNQAKANRKCRFCQSPLTEKFADLGLSPLANSYITPDKLNQGEMYYPLCAYVCPNCHLVQLEQFESPDQIFSDYAYYSSYSQTWLNHAQAYANQMINQGWVKPGSFIAEIASNDGYLLQNFDQSQYRILGIEPAQNIARQANAQGIPTIPDFFGTDTADKLLTQYGPADLLIANNVLAHVPDINDFVQGMKHFLAPQGLITAEFPHLLQLMQHNQFDTIYHEHFSYFSLTTIQTIFAAHGLTIFQVEQLPTHGGSLRIYAKHQDGQTTIPDSSVEDTLQTEQTFGLQNITTYQNFHHQVKQTKRQILQTLITLKNQGAQIVGYGAPAKGNTLLNYCGIGPDILDYTVDKNPAKQNKYLPGSRIPIYPIEKIQDDKPQYILILPWNLQEEIKEQMQTIKTWGGHFITLIPEIEID